MTLPCIIPNYPTCGDPTGALLVLAGHNGLSRERLHATAFITQLTSGHIDRDWQASTHMSQVPFSPLIHRSINGALESGDLDDTGGIITWPIPQVTPEAVWPAPMITCAKVAWHMVSRIDASDLPGVCDALATIIHARLEQSAAPVDAFCDTYGQRAPRLLTLTSHIRVAMSAAHLVSHDTVDATRAVLDESTDELRAGRRFARGIVSDARIDRPLAEALTRHLRTMHALCDEAQDRYAKRVLCATPVCPYQDTELIAYLAGTVTGTARGRFTHHLAHCATCTVRAVFPRLASQAAVCPWQPCPELGVIYPHSTRRP